VTPHAYIPTRVVDAWPCLSPKARTVAVALASFMPGDGGACWPGRTEIMRRAGLRRTHSMAEALAELISNGLLTVTRRPNRSNVYAWLDVTESVTTGCDGKRHHQHAGCDGLRNLAVTENVTRKDTRKVKRISARSRAQGANDKSGGRPRDNAWGLWVDCWRESGRTPDPLPLGPATRAAKELARLIPDRDELADVFAAFLGDRDKWLVSQGHSLALLPKRVDGYRARLAEADPPPLSPETIERIEAEAAAAEAAAAEAARGGRP